MLLINKVGLGVNKCLGAGGWEQGEEPCKTEYSDFADFAA